MPTSTEIFINSELPKRPYTNQFPLTAGHIPVATGNGLEVEGRILDVSDITNAASEQYVNDAISNLIDNSPGALDTLNELAAALGDDPNFASTVSTALSNRLRVDINTQGLTLTEKQNGLDNLGVSQMVTGASMNASGLITFVKNTGQASNTVQIPTAISGLSFDANTGILTSSYTNGAADTTITVAANEVADNVFRIKDNVDATKKIAFEASGVGAGQTRTITMPDANVNLANIPSSYDATWLTIAGTSVEPKLNITNSAGTLTQVSLKDVSFAQEYIDGATTQTISFGTRGSTHFNIGNAGTGIVTFDLASLASPYSVLITNNTTNLARQVVLQYAGGSIVENGVVIGASPQTILLDSAESMFVFKTGTNLRISRSRSLSIGSSDRSGFGSRFVGTFTSSNKIISVPNRDVDLAAIGKIKTYVPGGTAYETDDAVVNFGSLYRATTNFTSTTFGTDVVSNLSPIGIAGYIANVSAGASQAGSANYFIGNGGTAINAQNAIILLGGTIGSTLHTTSTLQFNSILSPNGGQIGTGTTGVLSPATYGPCKNNVILGGVSNEIKNGSNRSAILCGSSNITVGSQSSGGHDGMLIGNGLGCSINGANYSTVLSGNANNIYGCTTANGQPGDQSSYASILAGNGNTIRYLDVFGGPFTGPNINITASSIVSGFSCHISGSYSSILNGSTNRIGYNGTTYTSASYSTIGNGSDNSILSGVQNAVILNGASNTINGSGSYSSIVNGVTNSISGQHSAILGGSGNIVSNNYSAIISGISNNTTKIRSVVVSGTGCTASGTGVVILTGTDTKSNLGGAVVHGVHQTIPTTCGAINQRAVLLARVNGATSASLNTTAGGAATNGTDTKEVRAAVANGFTGTTNGSAIHSYMITGKSVSGTFRTFTAKYIVSCSFDGTTYYLESITTEHITERSAPNITVGFAIVSGDLICTITNADTGSDMWFSGIVDSMYI